MKQEKIFAPFTHEQVKILSLFQETPFFHPFTCGSPEDIATCERKSGNEGILKPTQEGWVCPCGKYKQTWAWTFMADKEWIKDQLDHMERILANFKTQLP